MTVRLEETQLARRGMVRKTAKAIRAHYADLADRELNEVLPAVEARFDAAVKKGLLPEERDIAAMVAEETKKARKALGA